MASSVNKAILVDAYLRGASLPDLARDFGISVSTARYHVLKAGALRSRADGIRNAASSGKLGSGLRGKKRRFTDQHRNAISEARKRWADAHAAGLSIKPSGYLEYTRGADKGRPEHVVIMERRIGRRLLSDEHVHHIDGNRLNNESNNLALVTRSGHARLHRIQDAMAGIKRERDANGRFR